MGDVRVGFYYKILALNVLALLKKMYDVGISLYARVLGL
jgi:hypothetical protein